MRFLRFASLLLIGLCTLSACEEDISPFIEGDVYYSLYGYLDAAADTQYIRVIPISEQVDDGQTIVTDATVRSIRLSDGNTVVWKDSTITFADGSIGTVFYAPLRVFPGLRYRLEVERSDGEITSAETSIPEIATPVEISSISQSTQRVTWPSINDAPLRVEVWYRFLNDNDPRKPFREVRLTYSPLIERSIGQLTDDGGWEVRVALGGDFELVKQSLSFPSISPPTLLAVGMRVAERDDQWVPPGGIFSQEILVQPGLFSNVENGFGFVGSVNDAAVEWTLTAQQTRQLGYAFPN